MHMELTETQRTLQEQARRLAENEFRERAGEWDREEKFPEENNRRLAELGYLGMALPEQYGGADASLVDTYLVIEELAKVDLATALLVHEQNVSPRMIAVYGSEEQKQKFLPPLISGDIHCSIAWTEPQAGSDGTAIRTTAKPDGKGYRINGSKVFTTYGDKAELHLTYVRFVDEDGKQGKGARGIGMVLIDKDSPGFSAHRLDYKMGVKGASEAELFFDDVYVPPEMVVIPGDPESSSGFVKPLMLYNATRVGMGVMALGIAEGAFDLAREYMIQREQFGKPLAEMQGLQWMMADIAIQIEAARALCYQALSLIDAGNPNPYLCSIAKVQATEMALQATLDCQQMFGGYGYFGSLPLERMVRDVRMLTITGGTTQVQKNAIAAHIFGKR